MTKLKRVTGKVFGGDATATGDNPEIGQFGSALAGTYNGTTDVATIQSLPAWGQGWAGAVTPDTNFPALPEMTGFGKVLSYQQNYILQSGIPEWDSYTIYYTNNFCRVGNVLYYSLTDDNQANDPTTDTTNWEKYGGDSENSPSRNIGEIVASTLPLVDAGLHILDGALISGEGIYAEFVEYIQKLYNKNLTTFYAWAYTSGDKTFTVYTKTETVYADTELYNADGMDYIGTDFAVAQSGDNYVIQYAGHDTTYTESSNVTVNTDSYFAHPESYSTYNVTSVGSPVNTKGILSNFSAANYYTFDLTLPETVISSEFTTKVNMAALKNYNELIKSTSTSSLNVGFGFNSSGNLGIYNTSSWVVGSTVYAINTDIWVKIIWDGTDYKIYGLLDDGYTLETLPSIDSWTLEQTYTSSTAMFDNTTFSLGWNTRTTGDFFNGTIDLNNTNLYINEELNWEGRTDGTTSAEEIWQEIFIQYGVCGKFVYSAEDNTVRLPKYGKQMFTGVTELPVVGNGLALGLSGATATNAAYDVRVGANLYGKSTAVAYSSSVTGTATGSKYGLMINNSGVGVTTDPAKSGMIAKLGDSSLDVYYYIILATSTKTDVQVDIDNIATDLNTKADTDLSNVPTSKGILTESYVNGTSGYRVYSDGWCEQWGYTAISSAGQMVNLLKSYVNTNYVITASGGTRQYGNTACYDKTTSSFKAWTSDNDSFNASNLNWKAEGYIR